MLEPRAEVWPPAGAAQRQTNSDGKGAAGDLNSAKGKEKKKFALRVRGEVETKIKGNEK